MSPTENLPSTFTAGPVWRDANVRSGPSLDSPILQVLLPEDGISHEADGWTIGDEVIEGSIVSDVWLRLRPDQWCSAVNFDPIPDLPPHVRIHCGGER
jgi:hypothetical protein